MYIWVEAQLLLRGYTTVQPPAVVLSVDRSVNSSPSRCVVGLSGARATSTSCRHRQGGLLTFLLSLSSNSVCMWCVYRHFNRHRMSRDGSARPRYLICNALPGCWINSLLNIAPLLPGSWSSGDRAWKPNFGCPQASMPRRFVRGESRFWDPGSRPARAWTTMQDVYGRGAGRQTWDSDMVCLSVITDKGGSRGSRPGASKCWFDGLLCPVTVA